eukprot:1734132-Pyramimonas_sp.AAC.2
MDKTALERLTSVPGDPGSTNKQHLIRNSTTTGKSFFFGLVVPIRASENRNRVIIGSYPYYCVLALRWGPPSDECDEDGNVRAALEPHCADVDMLVLKYQHVLENEHAIITMKFEH